MQACQTLFYLQKWFITGYKHSKTLIGHFIKWQNYLQKILPINHFQTKSLFYVVENAFIKVGIFIGFTKYIFKSLNLVFGVREFKSKHFPKGFLKKHF